tara:strand:+ start:3547 stop:4344 length:798 start_codon:yes stop_codon:yes gene_type:complete
MLTTYALTAFMPLGVWAHTYFFLELAGVDAPAAAVAFICAGATFTYVFDRVVDQPGDRAPTTSIHHAAMRNHRFAQSMLFACIAVMACTTTARALCTALGCMSLCIWYFKPLPVLGVCIKELFPLSKTAFVPLVHVVWPYGCVGAMPPWGAGMALWFSVTTSTIYMDVKDIATDRAHGVVTLPTLLGHSLSLAVLSAAYAVAALVALLQFSDDDRVAGSHKWAIVGTYAVHSVVMARYAVRKEIPTVRFGSLGWCMPWIFARALA